MYIAPLMCWHDTQGGKVILTANRQSPEVHELTIY